MRTLIYLALTLIFVLLFMSWSASAKAGEPEEHTLECGILEEDIPENMTALPLLTYATAEAEDAEAYPLQERMIYIGQDPCKVETGEIIEDEAYPMDGYYRLLEAFPVLYESVDSTEFIGCFLRVKVVPLDEGEPYPVREDGTPTPVADLDHEFKTFGEILGEAEGLAPTINIGTCMSVFENPDVPLHERYNP